MEYLATWLILMKVFLAEDAFVDLNRSIIACTEKNLRTKCQALCQRGVLYRKMEKLDEARADFEDAASLGSKFARTQVRSVG